MRESDLYKPVAQFFQREYGCVANETWIAGSGSDLAFPAGFGNRKPDIVACTSGTRREIHLAEGKLLNIPTHGFNETYNQLDSLKPYADYLWAVFPADTWASAASNHRRWTSQLRG